jgi:hypothetical protein
MPRKMCPICHHFRAHPTALICEPCLDELVIMLVPKLAEVLHREGVL